VRYRIRSRISAVAGVFLIISQQFSDAPTPSRPRSSKVSRMVRKMFSTLIRRAAQAGQSAEPRIPYIYTNQYKAKRLWPPDFTKISPKHQFRLERRYKRRAKLKWARPGWTKGVKIVQMSAVVCMLTSIM
jgi:hypothetical protein